MTRYYDAKENRYAEVYTTKIEREQQGSYWCGLCQKDLVGSAVVVLWDGSECEDVYGCSCFKKLGLKKVTTA